MGREYLARERFSLDAGADGTTVLGVVLPGASGFDILRCIRTASRIPVLMLIARGDDVSRIVRPEPEVAAFWMSIWSPPICNLFDRVCNLRVGLSS